ncbi:MAG: T9SS type A sorting domain-containing protein [Bacteroidales bacterium]|nr:T9SS type A sorting domain-containing protein [Bacteroidales bacterium]
MKKCYFIIVTVLLSLTVFSQGRIKVMSYNLLNFANYTSYCTQENNPHEDKAGYLATIVQNQDPDIIAVCELGQYISSSYVTNYILGNALNVNGETKWQAASPTNQSGSYLINGLFFDKTKFQLISQPVIQTDIRDLNVYKLKSLQVTEETFFYIVILHLKAGSGTDDAAERTDMVEAFMNYLSNLGSNDNFIVVGDFNVYSSNEQAFQRMINPSNPSLTFHDPINQLGDWSNGYSFREYHTQSTYDGYDNDCFSYGGMDDRFDFILISSSIKDGTANIQYVEDTYWAVGQDGNRFNETINSPYNSSLPSNVINALENMSDHLPVVADFQIGDNSSIASISTNNNFYANVVNPTDGVIKYQLKTSVTSQINVSVFTSVGQKVFYSTITPDTNTIYLHDISSFPSGIYFMYFEGDGIFQSYKIVKQ